MPTRQLTRILACAAILLTGAATGCTGSPAPPRPATSSPAGAEPAWRAPTHLDHSQANENPTSVSCPSASFCMAVLQSGYAATYDGTTWTQPARLPSSAGQLGEPDSVSCPTAGFCLAVDARDSATLVFKNGRWTSGGTVPSTQTGMASVSCPSASFCAAVSNGSDAFTFNGTSWSPATTIDPGGQLSTVSCPSPSFCAAVDYGPNVLTFSGTSWAKPSPIDPGGYLQAVSCARASFCVALDRKGNAFTFNGRTWSAPVNATPDGLTMGEGGISWPVVSCPATTFCAAVDGQEGNVVTFDGTSWTAPRTIDTKAARSLHGPVLIFLMSVSCPSATFCVAGDTTGDAFVRS